MSSWASEKMAVLAKTFPVNGNNAATATTGFHAKNFDEYLAMLSLGVIDQTVDFKLQCSDLVSGTYTDIPGKAITQVPGTGDNTVRIIDLKAEEIPEGRPFIRALTTVANGTSSLIDVTIFGLRPRTGPATDYDLASVAQIVR
jgi:hypothetical protein